MENLPCLVFPWLFFWNGTKPHPLPWFTISCQADRNRGHPNQGSCCKHSKSMNTEIAWTLTAPSGTQSSGTWNQSSSVLKRHSDWPSSVPGQQLQDCHLWLHHWHVLASCGFVTIKTFHVVIHMTGSLVTCHLTNIWPSRTLFWVMNLIVLRKFDLKHYQSFIDDCSHMKSHWWCLWPKIFIIWFYRPNLDIASFFCVSS